ncbi:hypothetical protein LTR95_001081 [Oleoguttula sp. CCFEE 5521]
MAADTYQKHNTRSHGRDTGTRVPIGSAELDAIEPARNKKRKINPTDGESDVESIELAASTTSHLSKVPEEVLEMILFELPMLDLFVVQRVSKRVRNSLETSPKIQEKMWLRAQSQPNKTWVLNQDSNGVLGCRLHTYRFPDSVAAASCPAGAQLVKPAKLNPFLRRGAYDFEFQHLQSSTEWMTSLAWHGETFDHMSRLPGTWRNMHVTNIPCTRAFVAGHYGWRHKRRSRRDALVAPTRLVRDDNTLSLGMLMDGVLNTQTFTKVRMPGCIGMVPYQTLAYVLQRERARYPGTLTFDLARSKIFLTGIATPTKDQWQALWDEYDAAGAEAAQAEADASTD